MWALAYVLVPGRFISLQSELDRTFLRAVPARRHIPRAKLTFDDATGALASFEISVQFGWEPELDRCPARNAGMSWGNGRC
jgi:hypothetical protein